MARSRGRGIEFLDVLPEDGERRLMLAVLIDAIQSYNRYRSRVAPIAEYHEWRRERVWFLADDVANPFSFISICAALGLNAAYVRRRVLRPSGTQQQTKLRRYSAKAEESWERQRCRTRQKHVASRPAEIEVDAPTTRPVELTPTDGVSLALSLCL